MMISAVYSISSMVCVAIIVSLSLLSPVGTEGGLIAETSIPSSSSFLANSPASFAGPIMIGIIGVSPSTTFNPPALKSSLSVSS